MKKTLKLSVILLGFALIFGTTSCKKYQEGPAISFRSKKARVANTWVVEKSIVDGKEESTSPLSGFVFEFTKDGKYNFTADETSYDKGTWDFGDKKETIVMTNENGDKNTATILKLKNKELWTKETISGVTFETHYKEK